MTIISSDILSYKFGRILVALDFLLYLLHFCGKNSLKLSERNGSPAESPPAPTRTGSLLLSKCGVGMQLLLAYSAEFESLIFLPEGSPKMKIQNVKTIVMQKLNLLVSFVLILKQKWIFEKIHIMKVFGIPRKCVGDFSLFL